VDVRKLSLDGRYQLRSLHPGRRPAHRDFDVDYFQVPLCGTAENDKAGGEGGVQGPEGPDHQGPHPQDQRRCRASAVSDVPHADVVITNPTHYAVALSQNRRDRAPKLSPKVSVFGA
jgi:hypothetical protein